MSYGYPFNCSTKSYILSRLPRLKRGRENEPAGFWQKQLYLWAERYQAENHRGPSPKADITRTSGRGFSSKQNTASSCCSGGSLVDGKPQRGAFRSPHLLRIRISQ